MSKLTDFGKQRRETTKMVPVPSVSIMPERDLGSAPALECLHLGIEFGGLKAVDDFNVTVGKTEICGLIGPNGAGKTTVFNLLTKVYNPTHGTIMVDGKDTAGMNPAKVNQLGVARTFQNIRLFNDGRGERDGGPAQPASLRPCHERPAPAASLEERALVPRACP